MSNFAKEFFENRLHLSKKQAFCVRFALQRIIDGHLAHSRRQGKHRYPYSPLEY
jgi:hypothetical protein